jgi:hypothetical protein
LGVFDPPSVADFRWKEATTLRKHRAAIYTYRIARANSLKWTGTVRLGGPMGQNTIIRESKPVDVTSKDDPARDSLNIPDNTGEHLSGYRLGKEGRGAQSNPVIVVYFEFTAS